MKAVDVLAVLDEVIADMGGDTPGTSGHRLAEARTAVAELIEAAQELDEELDGPAIAHRMRAALARVGGAS